MDHQTFAEFCTSGLWSGPLIEWECGTYIPNSCLDDLSDSLNSPDFLLFRENSTVLLYIITFDFKQNFITPEIQHSGMVPLLDVHVEQFRQHGQQRTPGCSALQYRNQVRPDVNGKFMDCDVIWRIRYLCIGNQSHLGKWNIAMMNFYECILFDFTTDWT